MAENDLSAVIGTHPLGLGAGPDRGGSGLSAALTAGFASIEIGTVTAQPEPDHNPGVDALVRQLSIIDRQSCRVGVNIGSQFASLPSQVAKDWRTAMAVTAGQADFFTLNLSAPYYAGLLVADQHYILLGALATAAAVAYQPLLVKLPFGRPDSEAGIACLLPFLKDCGVAGIVVSSGNAQADAARHLRLAIETSGLPVIATGGVRTAADLRNRLAAGALAVQVYSVYAEGGTTALAELVGAAISLRPR